MDDDKKKKRNKKKKNKQQNNKVNNTTAASAAGSASVDVIDDGQTSNDHATEITDAETDVVQNMEGHLHNGAQGLAEAEKQYWLDKEASLEEKMKQFQKEKDVQKEKEAILEEKIEYLLKEREMILQKEGSLEKKLQQLQNERDPNEEKKATSEERIVQLQKEREEHMQKEASLEDKIRQLQKEKDSLMQKEAELEMKIMHFEGEKQSWLQKEAGFEEKISQLMDEGATLSLKGVSLEEKIRQMERERDSWVQNENTVKETIASLNGDNAKLRAEVAESGELRNSLLQENQLLKEKITDLQSHIQNLENSTPVPFPSTRSQMSASGNGEVKSEIDAALMLVEKLISENAELVEKVNELYVELSPRGPTTEPSLSVDSHPESVTAQSAHVAESSPPASNLTDEAGKIRETGEVAEPILESSKRVSSSGEGMQSLEEVVVKDERSIGDYLNANDGVLLGNSSEMIECDEIVQIPLDENEAKEVMNPEMNEENNEVALTEAPLIGAPFRLISFVARYVSGADLVNK